MKPVENLESIAIGDLRRDKSRTAEAPIWRAGSFTPGGLDLFMADRHHHHHLAAVELNRTQIFVLKHRIPESAAAAAATK